MPTKRFESLSPERRAVLLEAAAAEFAAHGFEAASFNRIIERAGTSKGAIYYYFEDKADLYATVVRDTIGRFVAACGMPEPVADADAFWDRALDTTRKALRYYRQDPALGGIVRSLGRDALPVSVQEIRELSASWTGALVAVGQACGAVRTDVPLGLVLSVATSLTEGFDLWVAQHLDELTDADLDHLAVVMIDAYRKMAAPTSKEDHR